MRAWLSIALVLAAGCGDDPVGSGAAGSRVDLPNLILVIGDDHGYEDFGFMGSGVAQTPRLDALVDEGTVFTHGYTTASVCEPSLQTLLTGLQPAQFEARAAAHRRAAGPNAGPVVRQLQTLPRLLARRGYASFQSGKYFEGSFSDGGFSEGMNRTATDRAGDAIVREGLEPVLDFIDRHREQPFFLWFAPKLPHVPHDPPAEQMRRYAKSDLPLDARTYFAAVSWFDSGLGALLDHLSEVGVRERTLVVYLADNGWVEVAEEPLGAGDPRDRNVRWLGGPRGKLSLYDPGFRTPIVFSWPGRIEAGRSVANLVSIADVFPTLLSFAGLEADADRFGRDLRAVLERREEPVSETIIGHMTMIRSDTPAGERVRPARLAPGGFFLRSERWHYLAYSQRKAELYDLEADPGELRNVAGRHPEQVRAFRAEIDRWIGSLGIEPSPAASPAPPAS